MSERAPQQFSDVTEGDKYSSKKRWAIPYCVRRGLS